MKFREKDNATSLSWDEISKAEYAPWTSTFSTDAVVATAKEDINKSTTFGKIKTEVNWLAQNNDKEISLNIEKYKEEQKLYKNTFKQLDELSKLTKALDVKNPLPDVAAINSDKDKIEKNKQFIKRISSDIYIDETVRIMNNMIRQSNLAKVN